MFSSPWLLAARPHDSRRCDLEAGGIVFAMPKRGSIDQRGGIPVFTDQPNHAIAAHWHHPNCSYLLPSNTSTTIFLLLPRTGNGFLAVVPMVVACFVVPVGYIHALRLRVLRLACANRLESRSLKLRSEINYHLASHGQHACCALMHIVIIHWSQQSWLSSNVWLDSCSFAHH